MMALTPEDIKVSFDDGEVVIVVKPYSVVAAGPTLEEALEDLHNIWDELGLDEDELELAIHPPEDWVEARMREWEGKTL